MFSHRKSPFPAMSGSRRFRVLGWVPPRAGCHTLNEGCHTSLTVTSILVDTLRIECAGLPSPAGIGIVLMAMRYGPLPEGWHLWPFAFAHLFFHHARKCIALNRMRQRIHPWKGPSTVGSCLGFQSLTIEPSNPQGLLSPGSGLGRSGWPNRFYASRKSSAL
jgi:hypothetical protein